jgi:hypothetical protein
MDPSMLYGSQLAWSLLLVLLAVAGIVALEWRERAARRARRPGERRR